MNIKHFSILFHFLKLKRPNFMIYLNRYYTIFDRISTSQKNNFEIVSLLIRLKDKYR